MLKKQFIALLFASVLMVNLGHNIIPHHHHIDSIFSHQGCHDHDGDNNAFHAGNSTTHCHAFNGIEYFPTPEKHNLNNSSKTISGIYFSRVIRPDLAIPFQKAYHESRGFLPVRACVAGSASGLRGPPQLS
jgi:hypothetical protein